MDSNTIWAIATIASVSVAVPYLAVVITNDRACAKIEKHRAHYENMLRSKGMSLSDVPGHPDQSPSEAEFMIAGDEISISGRAFKILRLINKIKSGKISKAGLQIISDTPYSDLP